MSFVQTSESGKRMGSRILETCALILIPVTMVACFLIGPEQMAVASMVASVASLLMFFVSYEWSRPSLRETMPVVVLASLAAAGRIIFAPFPDVKPVSAITIVAGAVFGRKSGFMVGALAALVSNFFFGQGPWTPWQMYAWGLVGWLAGVLGSTGLFERMHSWPIYVFGFASGLMYGLIMNLWSFLGFFHPQSIAEALVLWGAALPLDVLHGVATVGFLVLLWAPWHRKLERLKTVYGLGPSG